MSTVTPPPPHIPSVPVSGSGATTALVITAPSQTLAALQNLQAGQSLQATVQALSAANQVQVQTALGLLTLQTGMSLPRGAVLTLVLNALGAQTSFQVTTVNGQPVSGGQTPAALSPQGVPASPAPLQPGQNITATLLRPVQVAPQNAQPVPPGAGQTPSGGPASALAPTPGVVQAGGQAGAHGAPQGGTVTPGTQATPAQATQGNAQAATQPTAAPQSARAPQAGGAPTNAAQTPPTQAGTTTSNLAPGTTQASTQATTLPSGTRFSATVQRVEAPNAAVTTAVGGGAAKAAATGKSLAPGQVISGTVTGRTAGGQPIVQTPTATFALGSSNTLGGALGEGAKISFRLDSAPLPPTQPAPGGAQLRAAGTTHSLINAKSWDDLGDALKALVGADPARLAQVAQTALPQPGAKLTSQMLFFLSALKGGDLKGLFGDSAMRVIDKERPGLLSRLGADFQTMARLADEPNQGDWRLALVPLWTGSELEQLRFFWRGGGGEDEGEDGEETRFVLDLELSQLGHLQIDGLVKAKRQHLDLIIRTDQPLPAEMRVGISDIFEGARETLGLGGQVAFQAAPGNFITVPGTDPVEANASQTSEFLA